MPELKLAFFILCHKTPEQVIRLINRLRDGNSCFVVHVDKRAPAHVYDALKEFSVGKADIHMSKRHRCWWGRFGIVNATISCIRKAVQQKLPFDYAFLLSGEDYPIKSTQYIRSFLAERRGDEFIESFPLDEPNRWSEAGGPYNPVNRIRLFTVFFRSRYVQIRMKRKFPLGFRPHLGSQWWCLSRECIEYLNAFIRDNRSFVWYFKFVFIPDESFFQSIISNSPYRSRVTGDDIRYADWANPNPKIPRTLELNDFEKLKSSTDLFARKFDLVRSRELLDKLDDAFGDG
jgi:hypothetical protein